MWHEHRCAPRTWMIRAAVAVALLPGGHVLAQPGSDGEAVHLSADVAIDTAAGVAYVTSPAGGIEAVDLRTGLRQWSSQAAARPLLLTGALLVGQAEPRSSNDLRLVTLDTRSNGDVVVAGTAELPVDVQAAASETLTSEFETSARRVDNDIIVTWEYTALPQQGRRPEVEANARGTPRDGSQGVIKRSGEVRMNLRTGATRRLLGVGTVLSGTRAVRLDANRLSVPEPGEQFLSSDSQHVLVSERIADDPVWEKYRWTVYERATLQRVGEVRSPVSFAPFMVQDGRIIHEAGPSARRGAAPEPKQLRAVSLSSGAEAWSVPLRDEQERVTLPP